MTVWNVEYTIKGRFYAQVEADTESEAREKAWSLYHDGGTDPKDTLEWEVDDLNLSEDEP